MNRLRSLLKSINSSFWLGLLTFLLIITVLPATARQNNRIQQPNPDYSNMLLEGVKYYETGKFSEAAELWRQTRQLSQQQNDRVTEAASLNYLSLAAQKLGQWAEASKAIDTSLEILQNKDDRPENYLVLQAQALNTKGSLQLAVGQTEAALKSWQEAEKSYTSAGDETGVLGAQINQTQALQSLGLYRRSQLILEQIQQQLETQPDSPLKATGLRSLGVTLQVVGDLHKSERVLKQSLAIAQKLNLPEETSATFFSLGNTARSSEKIEDAISLYQQAATTSNDNLSKLQAQLNQLRLLVSKGKWEEISSLMPQIDSNLTNLSPSRETVYAKVNFAESLMQMDRGQGTGETGRLGTSNKVSQYSVLSILQESL
ncbi:MAG: tetratricopeptide repeat protein, partial [Xenococcaceae cyanobacterium]